MFELRAATPNAWIEAVMADFDAFLLDHAACERKASATAMAFVSHYPDRPELARRMIDIAVEELDHFRQVWLHMHDRGLVMVPDTKDPYVRSLLKLLRHGTDVYLLDRLLIGGVVEARGHERFGLIADALEPGALKAFYGDITRSEAKHFGVFGKLACKYFDQATVSSRLDVILDTEADVMMALPLRAALH